ncbi:hypothetical protein ACM6Q7_16315 [Peribacillus butanolivorans]|uniref:hypothetical protein n=1 Tax=Peribacillus butanolivorans TaxID=421767 RepID=UPI0039FD6480
MNNWLKAESIKIKNNILLWISLGLTFLFMITFFHSKGPRGFGALQSFYEIPSGVLRSPILKESHFYVETV